MHVGECRSCFEIGVMIDDAGYCEMCASVSSTLAPTAVSSTIA